MPVAVHEDELRPVILSSDEKKPVEEQTVFLIGNLLSWEFTPLLEKIRSINGEVEAPDAPTEEQLASMEDKERELAEKIEKNIITKGGTRYFSRISLEQAGPVMKEAFQMGIRGWENFKDSKGVSVEYEANGNGDGPSDVSLKYIGRMEPADGIELMNLIAYRNLLTGKEQENSDSARS